MMTTSCFSMKELIITSLERLERRHIHFKSGMSEKGQKVRGKDLEWIFERVKGIKESYSQ